MNKSMLKVLFSGIVFCLFFAQANAAPTVKKLGMPVATTSATVAKSNTSVPGRAGTVRFNTTKTATAAAPKKISSTETDPTRLLPSSKYLQVVHSVKPGASSGSEVIPGSSSGENVVIKDRITALEGDMTTVKQDLTDHINNTDVHVTVSEKETWNGKQDTLTAGKGIEIEDNVVSATMKIPVGSEDAPHTAPIWIE